MGRLASLIVSGPTGGVDNVCASLARRGAAARRGHHRARSLVAPMSRCAAAIAVASCQGDAQGVAKYRGEPLLMAAAAHHSVVPVSVRLQVDVDPYSSC